MLNQVTIMGRLTRDPELRRTGSGIAVASFTLAVDRDRPQKESGQRETDFINCVAWRHTAEFVSSYFCKGQMAIVNGRLSVRGFTDSDRKKRYATEVIAENVYFGEPKRIQAAAPDVPNATAASEGYGGGDFSPIEADEPIPF